MNEKEEISNIPSTKKYKKVIFLLLVIAVFAGLMYASISFFGLGGGNKIAAKVNGNNILRSELQKRFEQDTQRAASQGIDTSSPEIAKQVKSRILEELINTELLVQAAKESGIEVSQEEVDKEADFVKEQLGGQEALSSRLSEVGMSESEFKKEVLRQLMIQKYLLENIDIDSTKATEDEINLAYKQASSVSDNIPPLSEIKDQVASQVSIDKQQKLLEALIEKLRSNANIEIL